MSASQPGPGGTAAASQAGATSAPRGEVHRRWGPAHPSSATSADDHAGCATTVGCGSPIAPTTDPGIAERIADHPCYSVEAHQYYARMHVPIAPGCNIQCNYCNRKFDCVNESRPGVTSTLLSPEQAVEKVKRVANAIPRLRVVGVAGPGEPLANAGRTLRTLELIRRQCPDLRLCLSTNGLTLVDHVDRIAELGIDHVTITINMTDPEIGARIYPWVAFRGRRYTGSEAAKILGERQLAGLSALAERNILCKVNSVLIPGINDEHVVDVSHTVKRLGAFLHNVMPLVSKPAHGTHFGLTGQREPSARELRALRERCETSRGARMTVMRHCRQCRADAIGLLGEDRSAQFRGPDAGTHAGSDAGSDAGSHAGSDAGLDATETYDLAGRRAAHTAIERWRAEVAAVRRSGRLVTDGSQRPATTALVAVASTGGGVVNQHFGRATEFWIYEAAERWARFIEVRPVPPGCAGPEACEESAARYATVAALLSDCAAVLCNKIGPMPRGALHAVGVVPIEVHDFIDRAVAEAGALLLRPGRAKGEGEMITAATTDPVPAEQPRTDAVPAAHPLIGPVS